MLKLRADDDTGARMGAHIGARTWLDDWKARAIAVGVGVAAIVAYLIIFAGLMYSAQP